jgi:hypothetical protein
MVERCQAINFFRNLRAACPAGWLAEAEADLPQRPVRAEQQPVQSRSPMHKGFEGLRWHSGLMAAE